MNISCDPGRIRSLALAPLGSILLSHQFDLHAPKTRFLLRCQFTGPMTAYVRMHMRIYSWNTAIGRPSEEGIADPATS